MRRARRFLQSLGHQEHGQSLVLLALAMVVVMGAAAISIDVGNLYAVHFHIENAADAAALAGATDLPNNPTQAVQTAISYAEKNGYTLKASQVQLLNNNTEIKVDLQTTVNNYFARVFGIDTTNVGATSAASTGILTEYSTGQGTSQGTPISAGGTTYCFGGLMPWGVFMNTAPTASDLSAGEFPTTLKVPAKDGTGGNFYALVLGANGGDQYRYNIADGAANTGNYQIGQTLQTKTGNMVGPTSKGFTALMANASITSCMTETGSGEVLVVVPIVSDYTALNGTTTVTIIGFACYALNSGSYVYTTPDQAEIDGYFLAAEVYTGGTITSVGDVTDYGAYIAPYLTQ